MKKKVNVKKYLIVWVLLCVISLYLATRQDMMYTNYSDLLTDNNYRFVVYGWALLNGFILCRLVYLSQPILLKKSVIVCAVFWVLGTFCPYEPNHFPIYSHLHILLAYACFSMINVLIIYSIYLRRFINTTSSMKWMQRYFLLLGLHGLYFMVIGGVNALFESSYTICLSGFLLYYVKDIVKD